MGEKILKSVTLPDSGVTLKIKRIGPVLANDIRKRMMHTIKKPEPPMQEVDLGGEKKLEPNEAHPDYLAALNEYKSEQGMFFLEELVRYGVECEVDAEAVAQLREFDDSLPKGDLVVYVTRIALASQADIEVMRSAVLGQIQPTEAAVAQAAENFPGKVLGA